MLLERKHELCAAIMIKDQDFCAVFDHEKKTWKRSGNGQETKRQINCTTPLRNILCPIRAELHTRQNWRHGSRMAG